MKRLNDIDSIGIEELRRAWRIYRGVVEEIISEIIGEVEKHVKPKLVRRDIVHYIRTYGEGGKYYTCIDKGDLIRILRKKIGLSEAAINREIEKLKNAGEIIERRDNRICLIE